jgi:hypothetical protein
MLCPEKVKRQAHTTQDSGEAQPKRQANTCRAARAPRMSSRSYARVADTQTQRIVPGFHVGRTLSTADDRTTDLAAPALSARPAPDVSSAADALSVTAGTSAGAAALSAHHRCCRRAWHPTAPGPYRVSYRAIRPRRYGSFEGFGTRGSVANLDAGPVPPIPVEDGCGPSVKEGSEFATSISVNPAAGLRAGISETLRLDLPFFAPRLLALGITQRTIRSQSDTEWHRSRWETGTPRSGAEIAPFAEKRCLPAAAGPPT